MEITKIKIGNNTYDVKDTNATTSSDVTKIINQELYGSDNKPENVSIVTTLNITNVIEETGISTSDTKNTTGASNKAGAKMFLIGSLSLGSYPITYSNAGCYIGDDNCIYSNGSKVLTSGEVVGDGDTKNTTGTSNKVGTKLFLAGATTQDVSPKTYSNVNCYVGTDNCLYSNGNKTVDAAEVAAAIYTELYGNATKPAGAYTVTSQNITNAITDAGITTGGGANTYAQLGYAISRINGSSGTLTIPGTDPLYLVTVSSNISSVKLTNNPGYGHSCHVIFKSADNSSYTVAIGNHATNRICPSSEGMILTVPPTGTGYIEVDFLNMGNSTDGNEVYVRGV